jgi:hypothetical protein
MWYNVTANSFGGEGMSFVGIAWWAYLLTVLAGLGLGALQSLLLKRAVLEEQPKMWLFAAKVLLWAAALVITAFLSIPMLVVLAAVSSATYVVVSMGIYRRIRKEAN